MAQKTVTEKDMYLQAFENEYQITLKTLRAYPAEKSELKPAEKLKNARELAWVLVLNQMVVTPTIQGDLRPGAMPIAPKAWSEVLAAYENTHRDASAKLNQLTDDQMNRMIQMPVGPKQMGDVRIADALWMFLSDTIHHRGQISVYLRIAGGRLPSIYGPTADEPWYDEGSQAH